MAEAGNERTRVGAEQDRQKVILSIWSWHISGINTFALRLASALKNRLALEPEILCGHPPPPGLAAFFEELQIPVVVGPWEPSAFIRFGKSHLRGRVPLAFVAKGPFDFEMARVLSTRTRLWFWSHGLGPNWESVILTATGFGADICIPNKGQYLVFRKRMPRYGKFHCAPLWVDAIDPRPAPVQGPLLLVHSGRLDQDTKRVALGIELATLLRQRKVAFRLDYLGEGPHRKVLEKTIHGQGLEPWVRLLPAVPPQSLGARLTGYHMVLSFSKRESFGLAVLEGMAAGLRPLCLEPEQGLDFLHDRPDLQALAPDVSVMADRIAALAEGNTAVAEPAFRQGLADWTIARFGIEAALPLLRRLATETEGSPPAAPGWFRRTGTLIRLKLLCARAARRARAFRKQ